MRRKTKQLLATGMALAVLATNLTPLSLAAETAAEMQTGEAATQALSDEIALYGWRDQDHSPLGNVHVDGSLHFSNGGTTYTADWKATCSNDICKLENVNFRGTVGPFSYDRAVDNCTEGKVYYFDARSEGVSYRWSGALVYNHSGTLNIGAQKYVVREPGQHDLTVTWNGNQATITCSRGDVSATLTGTEKCKEIVTKATCEAEGLAKYCYAVEYDGVTYESDTTFDKAIPKTGHSYDADAWTWTADENSATATVSLKCTNCSHIEAPVEATVTKDTEASKPATCTADGAVVYTAVATFDGQTYTDTHTVTLPKLEHEFINYVSNNDATCTKDGTKTATCERSCGETNTVPDEGSKLEHNFDGAKPSKWEWSADYATVTVTLPCQNGNPDCTATTTDVTGDVSWKENKKSTCTEKGEVTYTATYNGYTDTVTRELPLADHVYSGEPTWTWNADHTKATATFKCDVCGETAESTGIYGSIEKTTVEPTCTKEGSTTYSTYVIDNGKKYETEDVVPIAKVAHDCSLVLKWDDDTYTSATAKVKCDNCDYERVVDAVVTSETTEPTCTEDGYINHVAKASAEFTEGLEDGTLDRDHKEISGQTILPATGHFYFVGSTTDWNEKDKTAVLHFVCAEGDDEQTVTVQCEKKSNLSVAPTCTTAGVDVYGGYGEYEFVFDGDPMSVGGFTPNYEIVLPATGHHYGAYHCTNNGTEVAACDYCGATTTRAATGSAVCDVHTVDGASVCPVCGKVNGSALLPQITADSDASTKAITSGAQLVVRAGTLPSGQKILTVAYLDANGEVLNLTGSWKVRVPLAELQAQLGTTEGNGFEHTLTLLAPNGEKKAVGFAVENGTVIFDATFNNSTACILLVD